ncbi:uncharacterized protein F4822DRAFT_347062 [Hypoxylon trugodes]|uniref:uncharacterized protein n=1 Tax=Hypoxylon trugodes TaxID=326681 RepID=UPI0021904AD4|nr:uncharacterized protein F4822DRAFT_347062 [Hypoxylon trugodes]KAI1385544.1 hypothetical protein F4822DRAFT_347062 [Hypoxylon trugodes]
MDIELKSARLELLEIQARLSCLLGEVDTIMTSSSVTGDITPTHTTATDETLSDRRSPPPPPQKEDVPWPGHTFIIRDPASGRQVTLVRGELRMEEHMGDQGGYHWICVEKNGWLGFCDPVHGTYIGHDSMGSFISQVKHHKTHEYFCARRHPDGGYILSSLTVQGLSKMTIGEDGQKLVQAEGTAFEFIKV